MPRRSSAPSAQPVDSGSPTFLQISRRSGPYSGDRICTRGSWPRSGRPSQGQKERGTCCTEGTARHDASRRSPEPAWRPARWRSGAPARRSRRRRRRHRRRCPTPTTSRPTRSRITSRSRTTSRGVSGYCGGELHRLRRRPRRLHVRRRHRRPAIWSLKDPAHPSYVARVTAAQLRVARRHAGSLLRGREHDGRPEAQARVPQPRPARLRRAR